MTTTTSSVAPSVILQPVENVSRRRPGVAQGRSARQLALWAACGVGGVGLLAWALSALTGAARQTDALTVAKAERLSFPVVLKQKGELKAGKSVDVKCEVEGRSTIIWLIPEGSEVKEGDLLVKLASNDIEEKVRDQVIREANSTAYLEAAQKELEILLDQSASDIRKAELALTNARTDLEKYIKGDWEQAKLAAQLDVDTARKRLERAQSDYEDSQKLYEKKFVTKGDMLRDEMTFYEARVGLQKAELALAILNLYTHPKEQRQKESDVGEAEKELERVTKNAAAKQSSKEADVTAKSSELDGMREKLAKFRDQQAKTEMKAPAAGLVVYENGERMWRSPNSQIAEGSEVYERQTLIKLPDTSVMVVKTRIHEAKTDKIKQGQPARVTIEGLPGRTFTGQITKIAVLADSSNQWLNPDLKEYETEITLDGFDPDLKPGVTAQAEIISEEVKDELAIPTQSVFMKGGHGYVFRGTSESNAEPVEVILGASSNEHVVVKSGLAEGDKILLAVSDDLKRKLPEPPKGENGNGAAAAQSGVTSGGATTPGRGGPGRATGEPPRPRGGGGQPAGGGGRSGGSRGPRPRS